MDAPTAVVPPPAVSAPLDRLIEVANALLGCRGAAGAEPAAVRDAVRAALDRHSHSGGFWPDAALDAVARAASELIDLLGEQDTDRAAHELNRLLACSAGPPRLSQHGGRPWHLHVDPVAFDWEAWFTSSSALALALALGERGRVAWGCCRASSCGRAFVDSGRGGPRFYCSTTCATRTRVADLRDRRRREDLP